MEGMEELFEMFGPALVVEIVEFSPGGFPLGTIEHTLGGPPNRNYKRLIPSKMLRDDLGNWSVPDDAVVGEFVMCLN